METKVSWRGGLSFSGEAESGFTVALDSDPGVGGGGEGFRPMELFAIGLVSCTGMDVISILNKKRQQVTGFEVQGHLKRAGEHPKVFTSAVLEYFITGHALEEEAVVRAIELSAVRYCPAQAMLGKIMPIELKYHIYEDKGEGERSLVKSGIYTIPPEEVKA
jgi:putative redox protein